MSVFSYYLGIDVSKDSFDACLIDAQESIQMNEKFKNGF